MSAPAGDPSLTIGGCAKLARTDAARASWRPPMADVLEGRRGSPCVTVCGPGEPFVTAGQRISDFAVNSSFRGGLRPTVPDGRALAGTTGRATPALWWTGPTDPPGGPGVTLGTQVPGAFDAAQPQLHVQPFAGPGDLPFARDMLTTQGVVCLASTASAHRHPPVRLGRMVLVESSSDGCHFGRDHDSPHRRPIMAGAKPEGATQARGEQVSSFGPPYCPPVARSDPQAPFGPRRPSRAQRAQRAQRLRAVLAIASPSTTDAAPSESERFALAPLRRHLGDGLCPRLHADGEATSAVAPELGNARQENGHADHTGQTA